MDAVEVQQRIEYVKYTIKNKVGGFENFRLNPTQMYILARLVPGKNVIIRWRQSGATTLIRCLAVLYPYENMKIMAVLGDDLQPGDFDRLELDGYNIITIPYEGIQ